MALSRKTEVFDPDSQDAAKMISGEPSLVESPQPLVGVVAIFAGVTAFVTFAMIPTSLSNWFGVFVVMPVGMVVGGNTVRACVDFRGLVQPRSKTGNAVLMGLFCAAGLYFGATVVR